MHSASGSNVAVTAKNGKEVTGIDEDEAKTMYVGTFTNGSGTLDAVTGAGTISWETDKWQMDPYPTVPGPHIIQLEDPQLDIAADGSGALSFKVTLLKDSDLTVEPGKGEVRQTMATFADVSELGVNGGTLTPDFAGRPYAGYEECDGTGGSWPAGWIDFLPSPMPNLKAFFYTTTSGGGCTAAGQVRKPALPVHFAWNASVDSSIVALTPARILDSRADGVTVDGDFAKGGALVGGTQLTLDVAGRGGVPDNAKVAVLNVTATEAEDAAFVTVWPCDAVRPTASSLNVPKGGTVPNMVVATLAADGTACLFSNVTTHLIADVTGYISTAVGYTALTPARLADTRADGITVDGDAVNTGITTVGGVVRVPVEGRGDVPAAVSTAVLNVTVTEPVEGGFVTVWDCDATRPLASSVNYAKGQTVANTVFSSLSSAGEVCLFTSNPTHLVVDINGAFTAGASLAPLTPARLVDTRDAGQTVDGDQQGGGRTAVGATFAVDVADRGGVPADARSVVVSIVATDAVAGGFVTVYDCGQTVPNASAVNYTAGSN
ncbi:MAG TPA: hypothetical protein PLV68_05815, partial [Ilumatobacteraceae bacterium]|nr:hypothetical protein [Ilumatobacteraceae bacterium]